MPFNTSVPTTIMEFADKHHGALKQAPISQPIVSQQAPWCLPTSTKHFASAHPASTRVLANKHRGVCQQAPWCLPTSTSVHGACQQAPWFCHQARGCLQAIIQQASTLTSSSTCSRVLSDSIRQSDELISKLMCRPDTRSSMERKFWGAQVLNGGSGGSGCGS